MPGHEAALGAVGHDHRVLHHLRLDQAQDLGAEVLRPVRPADAAARHLAAAQMNPFHPRRVYEHFYHRPGLRQALDHLAVQLQRQIGLGLAVRVRLVVVGPQRRLDEIDEAADDAVLVQALHGFELGFDPLGDLRGLGVVGGGIEAGGEQRHQVADDLGVAGQRLAHVGLREHGARLAQIFQVGAQDDDLAPAHGGVQHQLVEAVVLGRAVPHLGQRVLERGLHVAQAVLGAGGVEQQDVVDPGLVGLAARTHGVGLLLHHLQAQILQLGQHVAQRHQVAGVVDLHPQDVGRVADPPVDVEGAGFGAAQFVQLPDVLDRQSGIVGIAISQTYALGVPGPQRVAPLVAEVLAEAVLEMVAPGTDDLGDVVVEFVGTHVRHGTRRQADQQVQTGQRRIADLGVFCRDLPAQRIGEQRRDALPAVVGEGILGDVDLDRGEAAIGIQADERLGMRALEQAQDAEGRFVEFVGLDLEQVVARECLQDVVEDLAIMAVAVEAGALGDDRGLAPQHRDRLERDAVGERREHADEAPLADQPPRVVVPFHAHVIELDGPVNGRAPVRLADDQRRRLLEERKRGPRQRRFGALLAQHRKRRVAHQAKPRFRVGHRVGRAVAVDDVVFAKAQEGEVVVGQPVQEVHGLLHFLDRRRTGMGQQPVDGAPKPGDHGLPVVEGRTRIGQHRREAGLDLFQHGRRGLLVDLQIHV